MQTLDWYFDFVSPYSYLQHEILHTLDAQIRYQPVLFAGLLNAWGHKGPAEIPQKRRHTYRQVLWLAKQQGIPIKFPPAHPFNPLRALRLAIALDSDSKVIATIFRFIWQQGRLIEDDASWQALCDELKVPDAEARIAAPQVKEILRRNGETALARGVFGVPTAIVEGELFWGFDATGMLKSHLSNPQLFKQGEMQRVSDLPAASERRQK
ncbi:MAG: 2-hydroxychromene-2-carboxylate isomerase [Burkholderiales bacterium]